MILTCLSCDYHRPGGCARGMSEWPGEWLAWCPVASYLPGADEREDEDNSKTAQEARTGDMGMGL